MEMAIAKIRRKRARHYHCQEYFALRAYKEVANARKMSGFGV
jgi:hypothetical protein